MLNKATIGLVVLGAMVAVSSGVAYSGGDNLSALVLGVLSGWLVCAGAAVFHRWLGVLVSAVTAMVVSLYLGVQHAGVSDSICSVSATFDCDKVNTSTYSELFGVPIAFLGSGFYAAVVLIAILSIRGSGRYPRASHLVGLGALVSVVYSVFLAGASMSLGAWCLFCISLYGLNVVLLISTIKLCRDSGVGLVPGAFEGLRGQNDRSFGTMVAGGMVVFIAAMWWNGGSGAPPAVQSAADLGKLFQATEGPVTLDGTEAALGPVGAQYSVVEFADFECPSCAASFPKLLKFAKENPDIRVMFKHYPISSICNSEVEGERHKNACAAAMAAECAGEQGQFWELTRMMFMNQRDLDADGRSFLAKQAGLDMGVFESCLGRPDIDLGIRLDVKHAVSVGVHATPSIYLKGATGAGWVAIRGGVPGLTALVGAIKEGRSLPPTPPAQAHAH
jgi:protein-disulfide isomerase/uncharacterized membrane protein